MYPRKTILVGAAHCYSKTSKFASVHEGTPYLHVSINTCLQFIIHCICLIITWHVTLQAPPATTQLFVANTSLMMKEKSSHIQKPTGFVLMLGLFCVCCEGKAEYSTAPAQAEPPEATAAVTPGRAPGPVTAPAAVPAWYTVTPSTPLAASSPAGPVHTQALV